MEGLSPEPALSWGEAWASILLSALLFGAGGSTIGSTSAASIMMMPDSTLMMGGNGDAISRMA